jgi:hypothetical protein
VTVMIERYFGIPQHVIRMGLWAQMKPSEQSLYVCLMHESERYSTRRLRKTDAYLSKLAGLSPRAFCNARKKLQERKLVECKRGGGNIYEYTICNPETGFPWIGDSKARIPYLKKQIDEQGAELQTQSGWIGKADTAQEAPSNESTQAELRTAGPRPIQEYGVPLEFGKTY